jgi:hypothetical protein
VTRSLLLTAALAALLAAGGARASAAPPSPAAKQEAAERFDRGIRFYDEGNPAAALAEFNRAFELTSDPKILYNMALIYADLRRSVDAVTALERLGEGTAGLSPEQRQNAAELHRQHSGLVARVTVKTSVPAVIQVDGVEVGRTPLVRPFLVAPGTHLVGATAAGFTAPPQQRLDVAGGESRVVTFELAAPAAAAPDRERHTHDGLYLDVMAGLGYMAASATSASEDLSLSGLAQTLAVSAGWSINDRLVVHGTIYDCIGSDPSVERTGQTATETGWMAALGGAAGATWFFVPLNASVGARLGLERFQQLDAGGSTLAHSGWTPALMLNAGKQWWVSRNWGIGVAAQLHASMPLDRSSADAFSTLWAVLAASATFN